MLYPKQTANYAGPFAGLLLAVLKPRSVLCVQNWRSPKIVRPPFKLKPLLLHSFLNLEGQRPSSFDFSLSSASSFQVPTLLSLAFRHERRRGSSPWVCLCMRARVFSGVIKPAALRFVCGKRPGESWKGRSRGSGQWD